MSEERSMKESIFPNLYASNVKQLSSDGESLAKHQLSYDALNSKFGHDRQERLKQKLQRMLSKWMPFIDNTFFVLTKYLSQINMTKWRENAEVGKD